MFSHRLHRRPLLPPSSPEWPHAKLLPAALSSLSTRPSRHLPVAEAISQWLAHLIPPVASQHGSSVAFAHSRSAATHPSSRLVGSSLCSLLFPPHSLHPSNTLTPHPTSSSATRSARPQPIPPTTKRSHLILTVKIHTARNPIIFFLSIEYTFERFN